MKNSIKFTIALGLVFMASSAMAAISAQVSTKSASYISENGARLNADAGVYGDFATGWFEYGTSNSLSDETETTMLTPMLEGTTRPYFLFVGGLEDDTTYYFRACVEDSEGDKDCGSTLSFKTKKMVSYETSNDETSEEEESSTAGTYTSSGNSSSNSSSWAATSTPKPKNANSSVKDAGASDQTASVANAIERENSFFPKTLGGWLLAAVLIFFIVLFGRYLYLKHEEDKKRREEWKREMELRRSVQAATA